jgi:PAS domain-containing protein
MKTVCSFCKAVIRPGTKPDEPVSHGICIPCYHRIREDFGLDIRKVLDMLDAPVFLVDSDVRILAANTPAIKAFNKPLTEMQGKHCGTVLECINSCLPGGCGKTRFCPDCIIRAAVEETYETGHPVTRRHAVCRRRNSTGEETIKYLVSTRKEGDIVLLRLEPAEPV